MWQLLQALAFNAGLTAVFVPILQLVEQRIVTPIVSSVQSHGCNPRKLAGAIVVLIAAAPGAVMAAAAAICGGGGGSSSGGGGAGLSIGASLSTIFAKLAVLFGRSAAAGDMAKATPAAKAKAGSPNEKAAPKKSPVTVTRGQTPGRIVV